MKAKWAKLICAAMPAAMGRLQINLSEFRNLEVLFEYTAVRCCRYFYRPSAQYSGCIRYVQKRADVRQSIQHVCAFYDDLQRRPRTYLYCHQ